MVDMESVVRSAFQQSQASVHAHPKLIKSIEAFRNEEGFSDFFFELLKRVMLYHKREPAVEKIIDFVIKFTLSKPPSSNRTNASFDGDDCEQEDVMDPFLLRLFSFLLDHNGANDKAVRYRVCQIVYKLLKLMGDEDTIDEDLADRIFECMLTRITDKVPTVRIQATLALSRLQDPTDKNCAVIEAYLQLINTDGNADVRKAILRSIALTKSTLPSIIERTRDTKDSVRSTAYLVIANQVHIKALTIAQRLQILNSGLQDRSETVRRTCSSILLKNWMSNVGDSVLNLLQCLDVENSLDVNEVVMETILNRCQIEEQITALSALAEPGKDILVDFQSLTPEVAFFWRSLLKHVAGLGTRETQVQDQVLPGVSAYGNYISRYTSIQKESQAANIDFASSEFITIELIKIAEFLDYSDEVGRKHMNGLLLMHLVDSSTSQAVIPYLVARLAQITPSQEELTLSLAEIIADIKEPIVTTVTPQMKEHDRETKLKLAKITVLLNEFRDNLQESIKNEEFEAAANFKEEIKCLEAEKNDIEKAANENDQQQRIVKDDDETNLKCLTVASAMLECLSGRKLSPTVSTLVDTLILPGVQHANPILRNTAIRCLGLCSLMSKDFACHHLVLFLQVAQMDQDIVKVTSLQVIFDLLQMFGIETFPSSTLHPTSINKTTTTTTPADQLHVTHDADSTLNSNPENCNQSEAENESASGVLEILLLLLDSENWDVRTTVAEGMAKLLLSGRISSPRLLSRLFLLWYNPTSEDDIHLRHCLGVFFPVFAYMSRSNQQLIQEAFLPTFRTICNAPSSSPLSTININNVADLFVKLTRPEMVDKKEQGTFSNNMVSDVHESLAMLIANELLSGSFDAAEDVRVLCRTLASLQLKSLSIVNDLSVMTTKLLKVTKDKLSITQLIKFQRNLTFWSQELVATTCPAPVTEACEQLDEMEIQDSVCQTPANCQSIPVDPRKRPRNIEKTPLSVKATEVKRLSLTGSSSPESASLQRGETRRSLDPELGMIS